MGQHTWFHKSSPLYFKEKELWNLLAKSDEGEKYLDPDDYWRVTLEAEDIAKENDAGYFDLFRTNKRNEDGTYTDDIIFSREECEEWLIDNDVDLPESDQKLLNKFWDEYPDGVIDFG